MNVYDYYITPEEYEEAERNGIGKKTLDSRIRVYGWRKKRAITEKTQRRTKRGKYLKIAENNGINPQTFYNRVNIHGWSEDDAATRPKVDPAITIEKNGRQQRKTTDDILKKAAENNIPRSTLFARIEKGYDMETAATVRDLRKGRG
ncbi:hypothetical protein SAMN04488123_12051 [Natribacillus halophilus]|uniref:Uncharacterized protein n=2 Tax=Natribacillus halophilus TaxID=549003 RepID=A0A1G8RUA1_9BACI|nr:hypothetical protein SAMN04488123_12051 [Natribacillus halophilus]